MGFLSSRRSGGEPGPDGGLRKFVAALPRRLASLLTPEDRRHEAISGVRPEPIPSFQGSVEAPEADRVGICCSGGGIRSAAFNLGALQVLQEKGVLAEAKYLAAVSGGSYIAAAFAMVGKTWVEGSRPPVDSDNPYNGHDDSNPSLLAAQPAFARGSPEEQYLRNRSGYLAPDGMGTLFLIYRLLLGMLVNLGFLLLPLFGIAALLGIFVYVPAFPALVGDCNSALRGDCAADLPPVWWLLPASLGLASVILGVAGLLRRTESDRRRRRLDFWATELLLGAGLIAFFSVALPLLIDLLRGAPSSSQEVAGAAGGLSLASLLAGALLLAREAVATPKKAVEQIGRTGRAFRGLSEKVQRAVVYVAAYVFGPVLFAGVIVATLSYTLAHSQSGSVNWSLAGVAVAALVLFALACALGNLTTWSLHPFYKRRLASAFALKRVRPSDLAEDPRSQARKDVCDDEEEGIAVERDYDTLVPLSRTDLPHDWPTLLVCAAANVSDPGATPPGRRVTSFTFSAETIGGPLVGAMKTQDYEGAFEGTGGYGPRDFTLPAAVAMSGAAVSPSMGKITRRPFTFLMALANIRLGVWVPNPRHVAESGSSGFTRPRPINLFWELIGRNRVNARYLYVTDGGHYENLGLVELLRRGCTRVYCFDASGGRTFRDLGDAISLARSELGVEIDINPKSLRPDDETDLAENCVKEGTITYPDGTKGTLIYARNVLTKGVPWDVKAYHEEDPAFPHNTTADQLYTGQRFEGYRALGEQAAREGLLL